MDIQLIWTLIGYIPHILPICLASCILNTFKVYFKFSEMFFFFYLVSYLSLGYGQVVYLDTEDFPESLMIQKYLI